MKKFLKRLCWAAVICALLVGAGLITLRFMFPPAKIKTLLTQYAQKNWGREVTFDSLSFGPRGLKLSGFALSEKSTFNQGTFIKATDVTAKLALKPLLKKRIEIHSLELNGVEITLIKQADGSFNFSSAKEDPLEISDSSAATSQPSTDTPLILQAQELRATDCRLVYLDQTSGSQTAVDHFNLEAHNFDLSAPFGLHLDFTTRLSQKNQKDVVLPLSVDGNVTLANLDWPRAQADIQALTLSYNAITLALQGTLKNFIAPDLSLSGTLSGISHQALTDLWPNLPPFSVPVLSFATQAKIDLENSRADVSSLQLSAQDNHLQTKGSADWDAAAYTFSGTLQTDLSQLLQMAQTSFQPSGKLDGSFQFSAREENTHLSGKFNLQEVNFAYEPFTFEKLKGTVTLASLTHFSGALTGLINQENFVGNFDYESLPAVTNWVLNATLDKLVLTAWPKQNSAGSEEASASSSAAEKPQKGADAVPLNLTANLRIGEIIVPHFRSNGLTLNAALTGLSDSMANANGTLNFTFQPGAITGLDALLKENKFAKIILLPLAVLRKVSTTLNLGLFPNEGGKGEIAFSQAQGAYTFVNGLMNVDETLFKSTVTTISGSGTIDFPQDQIDMKATATVLTQAAPVVIKITGSPQDPKGKLDVARTVGSVLEGLLSGKGEKAATKEAAQEAQGVAQDAQTATKDTLQDAAKALKDLGSLFKKN